MENRDKIQHLRGNSPLTIDKAKELGMLPGEIAIKHGVSGDSELYVLSQDGEALDTFVPKSYIDSKIFYGTQAEYDEANAAGNIAFGAIVIIVDEEEKIDGTSSKLGDGVLGEMILG